MDLLFCYPKLIKENTKNPNNNKHSSSSPAPSSFLQTLSSITAGFFQTHCRLRRIGCSHAVNLFNRPPKPFCDNDTEFDYPNSGATSGGLPTTHLEAQPVDNQSRDPHYSLSNALQMGSSKNTRGRIEQRKFQGGVQLQQQTQPG